LYESFTSSRKGRFLLTLVIPKNNKQRINPAHLFPGQPMVPYVGAHYNTFLSGVKHNLGLPKNHSGALDACGGMTVYMEFLGSQYVPAGIRYATLPSPVTISIIGFLAPILHRMQFASQGRCQR
jgi:hypothetical protein